MYKERTYRRQFNSSRFSGFEMKHNETDVWIGVDQNSYNPKMEAVALKKINVLRKKLDDYIKEEPNFKKSLKPFHPGQNAPFEAIEMAKSAENAGIGPMSTVAGLFSQQVAHEIIQNFSVRELVIENGGDICARLNQELVLSVFAGESPLSEKIGLVIPPQNQTIGICTSAGTIGPSLSYGKADAVVVVAENALVADAWATALGNKVKSPDDVEKVIHRAENIPEILSLLIICGDKIGIRGDYEIKLLK